MVAIAEVLVAVPGEEVERRVAGIKRERLDQVGGIADGQVAPEESMCQAQNGGVRSDAEGELNGRQGSEAGGTMHHSECVA